MTPDDFRRIALAQPQAVEGGHMGHADFRVKKGIFASLGSPGLEWGSLMLTPERQEMLMRVHPGTFEPASGAWGRRGWTKVRLSAVDGETLESAMRMAWETRSA